MTHDPALFDEDEATLAALAGLSPLEPPGDLRERFRLRAAAHLAAPRRRRWWIPAVLAALLVLGVGAAWWNNWQQHHAEVTALRAELNNALNDLSAARRLEAINTAGSSTIRDDRVVEVLTHALLTDPNTNVRVAAAEALGHVANARALTLAAERSFGRETSPFVQAVLLTSTERLSPEERGQVLVALLARRDLDPLVRAAAMAQAHL
ncbi:MAG TPA: HEAT repeat domain-containing protein [Gemmatimonadales bacterium]|jgi:hypothetical protein|nr:HEAT repeat domain-containing protein [Gemmatimonadales bacterium]